MICLVLVINNKKSLKIINQNVQAPGRVSLSNVNKGMLVFSTPYFEINSFI